MVPFLAVDPTAELTVAGRRRSAAELLAELDPADREGVRPTGLTLRPRPSGT
jgi:2-amino-4-hydroxy-6-hydroxymethyldihydropteridine diphosphokinase